MADLDYAETSPFDRKVGRAAFRWVHGHSLQNIEGCGNICFRCCSAFFVSPVNIEQGNDLLGRDGWFFGAYLLVEIL